MFMVCSMVYMFFSCVLLKLTSSQPITTEVCNITLFITIRIVGWGGGVVGGCGAGDEVGKERQLRSILLFGHYDFQITNFYMSLIIKLWSNISNKINDYFIHVINCCAQVSALIQLLGGESNISGFLLVLLFLIFFGKVVEFSTGVTFEVSFFYSFN